ncbi:MAG: 3-phosphoshikimate 1-carboxyvinyltransferase [Flavobacteriales bacterium]|nr:3-phosphoshikimate 1-carboxyvinyltransferase [Flavobacteriales bacterium]
MLTGSDRMKQRPISILVNSLRELGASIDYAEKQGFPPIKIQEGSFSGNSIAIDGGVSSQYISSLMLIAPMLTNGLEINIVNDLVSRPYLEMTVQLMSHFGADVHFENSFININPRPYKIAQFSVESDWSAASYWYEVMALSDAGEVELMGLKPTSLQGDSVVSAIFKNFGVETAYTSEGVILRKVDAEQLNVFEYDFTLCPDLAQTVAVTCAGLGIEAKLTGLKTLKIKETDRIVALKTELGKFGISCSSSKDSLRIHSNNFEFQIQNSKFVQTYEDHRMAMAFAPLALRCKGVEIENPGVVNKSYPGFWKDLESIGFLFES